MLDILLCFCVMLVFIASVLLSVSMDYTAVLLSYAVTCL
jgi:hypothetical protein